MKLYRVLADAAKELEVAALFYERSSQELGQEFIDEFERAMVLIMEMPQAWRLLDSNFRRFLFRRFPYTVIYWVESSVVIVTSVFHQRRRPNSWRQNQ